MYDRLKSYLIRVFLPDNLKKNDKEMQALLKRVWPKLTKNTLDKIMPKPPRNGMCSFYKEPRSKSVEQKDIINYMPSFSRLAPSFTCRLVLGTNVPNELGSVPSLVMLRFY